MCAFDFGGEGLEGEGDVGVEEGEVEEGWGKEGGEGVGEVRKEVEGGFAAAMAQKGQVGLGWGGVIGRCTGFGIGGYAYGEW